MEIKWVTLNICLESSSVVTYILKRQRPRCLFSQRREENIQSLSLSEGLAASWKVTKTETSMKISKMCDVHWDNIWQALDHIERKQYTHVSASFSSKFVSLGFSLTYYYLPQLSLPIYHYWLSFIIIPTMFIDI